MRASPSLWLTFSSILLFRLDLSQCHPSSHIILTGRPSEHDQRVMTPDGLSPEDSIQSGISSGPILLDHSSQPKNTPGIQLREGDGQRRRLSKRVITRQDPDRPDKNHHDSSSGDDDDGGGGRREHLSSRTHQPYDISSAPDLKTQSSQANSKSNPFGFPRTIDPDKSPYKYRKSIRWRVCMDGCTAGVSHHYSLLFIGLLFSAQVNSFSLSDFFYVRLAIAFLVLFFTIRYGGGMASSPFHYPSILSLYVFHSLDHANHIPPLP